VLSAKVPTAAERIGDFSGALTGPLPHDPITKLPFPGNKIPMATSARPVWQYLIYPAPQYDWFNHWVSSLLEPIKTRQDSIRGDINISKKMNLLSSIQTRPGRTRMRRATSGATHRSQP